MAKQSLLLRHKSNVSAFQSTFHSEVRITYFSSKSYRSTRNPRKVFMTVLSSVVEYF